MAHSHAGYVGRFAPSPTGPLHFGSLCSALASYLDARAHNGHWLLRIENLDPPREQIGADHAIIESLKAHRLLWDGDVLWQSDRLSAYQDALDQLLTAEHAFLCSCSRAQLASRNSIHLGSCIAPLDRNDAAVRLRTNHQTYTIEDRLLGPQQHRVEDGGDVVLKRRDGLFAYQLAVVVDDAYSGITDVVRGSDLLSSTAWQWLLQERLNYAHPRYLHLPLLTDDKGDKLSKRSHAPALDNSCAEDNIRTALRYLGQPSPPPLGSLDAVLTWAAQHWSAGAIPHSDMVVR